MARMLDVTRPMRPGMAVFEGDPPFELVPVARLEAGSPYALSRLTMASHAGTHVDAPAHFLAGGASVDRLALEVLCGKALVVDLRAAGPRIDAGALRAAAPGRAQRLLLRTVSSEGSDGPFDPGYAHLTPDAARYLLDETRVRLLGVDSPSVEAFGAEAFEVHRALLGASPPVVLVEGLDLRGVAAGEYDLLCLPLRVEGCDGAPARAVLVERSPRGAS